MELPSKISDWLDEKMGENTAYRFELCERSISILESLMLVNRNRDHDSLIQAKDLRQKSQEYQTERLSMKVTLKFLGLTLEKLPDSCLTYLGFLCKTSELLKLSNFSETSFVIALTDLRCRTEAVKEQTYIQNRKLADFRANFNLRTELRILEQQFESLQQHASFTHQNKIRELKFSWNERKINKAEITKRLKRLKSSGANNATSHKTIVAKKGELDLIQKKCQTSHRQLERFHGVPPSLPQIEEAVEKMEKKKKKLEQSLSYFVRSSIS